MRLADRNAELSHDETQGQIIAESIMDELSAGYRPLTAVNETVYDPMMDPVWQYSIAVEATAYQQLLAVRVIIEQQLEARLRPARYELVRWLANPDYMSSQTPPEAESESSQSSSSSSSSSTSSSSGGTSSGFGTGGSP
jgi:hypothetical protein